MFMVAGPRHAGRSPPGRDVEKVERVGRVGRVAIGEDDVDGGGGEVDARTDDEPVAGGRVGAGDLHQDRGSVHKDVLKNHTPRARADGHVAVDLHIRQAARAAHVPVERQSRAAAGDRRLRQVDRAVDRAVARDLLSGRKRQPGSGRQDAAGQLRKRTLEDAPVDGQEAAGIDGGDIRDPQGLAGSSQCIASERCTRRDGKAAGELQRSRKPVESATGGPVQRTGADRPAVERQHAGGGQRQRVVYLQRRPGRDRHVGFEQSPRVYGRAARNAHRSSGPVDDSTGGCLQHAEFGHLQDTSRQRQRVARPDLEQRAHSEVPVDEFVRCVAGASDAQRTCCVCPAGLGKQARVVVGDVLGPCDQVAAAEFVRSVASRPLAASDPQMAGHRVCAAGLLKKPHPGGADILNRGR